MSKKFLTFLKDHYLFLIFALLYSAVIISKFINHPAPFYDWDESLYVQSGLEMFKHHYFLFPVWQGKIWFDKPPLVPFLYASVIQLFFFLTPELAAHLFTLAIAIATLSVLYVLFRKVTKEQLLPTIAVVLTSLTPIFLQRAQVVNLDVFLLLGWVGYLLFYRRFWLGTFFLFIAVFSKSLIGFYGPALVGGYYIALLVLKKMKWPEVKKNLIHIVLQSSILVAWYALMLLVYGKTFWTMHIIESHFKRVTSSIESHFGQKTFYVDLAISELGSFFFISLVGLASLSYLYFRKKLNEKQILIALYLLPWFIFLNATKTKIFWYFFAAIPVFGFLTTAPLLLIRKYRLLFMTLSLVLLASVIYINVYKRNVFAASYASYDSRYTLSIFAKQNCSDLTELVDPETRDTFFTLKKLGLTITSTDWWGAHPATVYYFGKPLRFIYDKSEFMNTIAHLSKNSCIVMDQKDNGKYTFGLWNRIGAFDTSYLYRETK